MNDTIVHERGADLDPAQVELYATSHRQIIGRLRERGIRLLLLTPPCTNSRGRPDLEGHNRRLLVLSATLKELAVTENVLTLDLFHPLLEREAEYSRHDPSGTLIADGVHPDDAGGLVIAMEILQTWGLAPRLDKRISDHEQLQDREK